MKRILLLLALLASLGLSTIAVAQDSQSPDALCDGAEYADLTMMQFAAAEQVIDRTLDYRAILCTSAGAIYVDLYEKLTPITVNNFVFLAEQGYYDSTSFHRVIPNFMAQGGDPTATGRGGPGYRFQDEPVGYLVFDRPGLLAMANAGPGTNGSQFFITTAPTPHLNHKHTIFGDVLLGQENVLAIRERDPQNADAAAETLHTVLIITDPSIVDNSAVVAAVAPATQDEVVAAFESFIGGLPPSLPADEERTGYFTTEEFTASVPEVLRDDFAAFAAEFAHQYRYRLVISNGECNPSIFFSALGYAVDVFEDAGAAEGALNHDMNRYLTAAQGYVRALDSAPVYSRDLPTCAREAGQQVMSLYTIGRYLVTLDILVAAPVLDQVSPAQLLENLALQIEGSLGEIFRGEIR